MLDIISNLHGFSAQTSTTADVHVRPLSPSLLSFRIFFIIQTKIHSALEVLRRCAI